MDYGVGDLTKEGKKIDQILDGPVNHSLDQIVGALKESGALLLLAFPWQAFSWDPGSLSEPEKKFTTLIAKVKQADLELIASLSDEGKSDYKYNKISP